MFIPTDGQKRIEKDKPLHKKAKKPLRSMKDMIITMVGGTWLLIHQACNKKPTFWKKTTLQEFLNHFPPESIEKAFEQIYQILQVLDTYLIDNPQQQQYCMSPESKYISLITYATKLEINLCNFPVIWAVLSILLDTKSSELQYVKNLQQVINDYYEKCPTEVMRRLEQQTSEIIDIMYDSLTNKNFDRVSDDVDRVSGVVDNDSDKIGTDNIQMPYDNDNDTATGKMNISKI